MDILIAILIPFLFLLVMRPSISLHIFQNTKQHVLHFISTVTNYGNITKPLTPNINLNAKPLKSDTDIKKAKIASLDLIIYFGSQSGTSESFAFDLEKSLQTLGYKAEVVDLFDFSPEKLFEQKLVVFLVATYGDGDPTVGSESFFDWLIAMENAKAFEKISFAVFGLGNSQYEQFNAMGKVVFRNFKKLGANPICNLSLGDDDFDIEADFKKWKTGFLEALKAHIPKSAPAPSPKMSSKIFEIVYTGQEGKSSSNAQFAPIDTDRHHISSIVKVKKNEPISQDGFKWHADFDISREPLLKDYKTGYTLFICPRNDYLLVDRLCKRFGWDKRDQFVLEPTGESACEFEREYKVFAEGMSISTALRWYFDLTRCPKKSFFESLLDYVKHADEIGLIKKFLSCPSEEEPTLRKAYFPDFSIIGIFSQLKSLSLNFADFIQITPRLQPREFTVSSCPESSPDTISVTYSLVANPPAFGGPGVCTNYLKALRKEIDPIPVFTKPSNLVLPADLGASPVLMVAAGSGIAPFRGFVQKGDSELRRGATLQSWTLFFGCRHPENDFLYRKELRRSEKAKKGSLTNLFVAFSRLGEEKVYVQHLIERRAALVWEHLKHPKAFVYICGSTAMGRSVKNALERAAFSRIEGLDSYRRKTASDLMKRLKTERRLISELWG